jgi:outer membrane lipoprotein-sorting protein
LRRRVEMILSRAMIAAAMGASTLFVAAPSFALTQQETDQIVKTIDERQHNAGDFKMMCYVEQKQKDKNDHIFEASVYRRDADEKFLIMILKPKSEAGKGYLRLEKNLFLFDPSVGKWDRKTERERIANSDSRRSDYDESHLSREYDAKYVGEDTLGKVKAHHLELKVKQGVEVAFPVAHIWTDAGDGNLLKRQDFAESGKVMRTVYYPKWEKMQSESKKGEVFVPKEIRIFDEVEKGSQTTIQIQKVDLAALDANIFTKAWVESKSK